MALNFPLSPTNGQVFENWIYSSAKGAWEAKPLTASVAVTSDVAPSSPKDGDLWYNTEDGNTYVWYTDVDGSQWVQLKSDATLSSTLGTRVSALEATPSGLIPMIPASVVVSAGSASVASDGLVTFTNATQFSLNNVFNPQYGSYRIILDVKTTSAVPTGILRLRAAGTDASGASDYSWFGWRAMSWSTSTNNGTSASNSWGLWDTNSGAGIWTVIMDVVAPASAKETKYISRGNTIHGSNLSDSSYGGRHSLSNVYDGFTLANTATFNGTVQVFGYRQDSSMPLDFPTSPTNGQAYNGYVYSTAIGAWQAKPSAQSPFYTGDTPPGNPVVGDSWFNTNDGTMYVYYNDGNTSQWVEHRSEIARSQVGLVPVVPTSVTLGSGTASVDTGGTVTFNNVTSVQLNGVFTTQYNNYLQVCTFNTAATLEARQRLAHNGSILTGAAYGWAGIAIGGGSPSYYSGGGIDWYALAATQAATSHAFTQTIHNPMDATKITRTVFTGGVWNGQWTSINFSGTYNVLGLVSGIQMHSTSANTISGQMKIYGYN